MATDGLVCIESLARRLLWGKCDSISGRLQHTFSAEKRTQLEESETGHPLHSVKGVEVL